jgi:hypothetical protein
MQYSDTGASKSGIIQDSTFLLGGIDLNAYPIADRTRSANEHLRNAWHIIMKAYDGWKFMDDNQSDTSTGLPYADKDIESGTDLLTLPSGALTIDGMQIKTSSSGSYNKLTIITYEEFLEMGGDGRFGSPGTPTHAIVQGDIIRLLPSPNITVTSGLRVHFNKEMTTFAITDTTATPGFASPYHRIISIGIALDYADAKGLQKAGSLRSNYNDYQSRLFDFYSERLKARQPKRLGEGVDPVEEFS